MNSRKFKVDWKTSIVASLVLTAFVNIFLNSLCWALLPYSFVAPVGLLFAIDVTLVTGDGRAA